MNPLAYGLALPWLVVSLGCWIGYLLILQGGRILQRLEALEQRLAQLAPAETLTPPSHVPPGLTPGSDAPSFELPTLSGERTALSEFLGRRLLLIFFNPRCGFCVRMAEALAALPADGANGQPRVLVVTTGDADENRAFFAEHAIRCTVLLQQETEVASRYQAGGTPMGYLIDERGRIASGLAAGAEALLRLLDEPAAAVGANGKREHQGNRALSDSRIPRGGLAAGTPAPSFTLPRVDGGELCLAEYRGRRVLLVFSDPQCGPCDGLAPRLEEAYRRSGDVQVLMVSRGEIAANRAKVQQHAITFPVVLQRHWEIARQYAMFATPAGYLIDEEGAIAADVATGADAVLSLHTSAIVASDAGEGLEPCHCGKPSRQCGCRKPRRASRGSSWRGERRS